ncbi:MAG: hypothetical protein KAJ35_05790 [Thermoplasmata archaeon]|nr:hypothetical protein [Thermoplasmata archaeon]
MERSRLIPLAILVIVAILLVVVIIDWAVWWYLPLSVVGGCLVILGFLPRPREPEVVGEDVYHLHP